MRRYTPLSKGHSTVIPDAMRRTVALQSRRQADPVSWEVRTEVLRRDGMCVAFKLGFPHICRDRMGRPHGPHAVGVLTLEHVKDAAMMGKRAPSDPAHLLALCAGLNTQPPTREMRDAFRAYLQSVAN